VEHLTRIGIAGCGKIAEVSHIPGLNKVKGIKITALLDADPQRAEHLQKNLAPEAAVYHDLDTFLESGLDAISICTPNHLHCPMTLAALNRGLHVLCEKPIAGTYADANKMVAAADANQCVLQINHSLRYDPSYAMIARLVHEGAIGPLQHIRCIRAGGSLPNHSWSPGADWFVSKQAHGGLLLDIGIHMIDVMRWLGGEVDRVAGALQCRTPQIEVPDNVQALLTFKNGCTGCLELSWTLPIGANQLEVYGTLGRIRMGMSDPPLELTTFRDGESITTHPDVATSIPDSYDCFARAITDKIPSPTPGELGRSALAMCLAIAQSSATGQFVNVDEVAQTSEQQA